MDWRLSKKIDLETYLLFEDEFNETNPKFHNILGIGLSYDFKI
jgi:hypothetical protein